MDYKYDEDYQFDEDEDFKDEVGGVHGGGVGYNPQGVFCGECCKMSCKDCSNMEVTK